MQPQFDDALRTFEIVDAARAAAAAEVAQLVAGIIERKDLAEMEAALARLPDEFTRELTPETIVLRKRLPPLGQRPGLTKLVAAGTRVCYSDEHMDLIFAGKRRPSLQAGTITRARYETSPGFPPRPVAYVHWDDDLPDAWKAWKEMPLLKGDGSIPLHSLALLLPSDAPRKARVGLGRSRKAA